MNRMAHLHHPEVELLLACSRPNAADPDRIRTLLAGPLDWPRLTALAVRHGVVPLVARSLAGVAPEPIPAAMRTHGVAARLHAQFMTGELLRVVGLLESAGIGVLAFKGPALGALVYGDPALRQFSDLDLIVRAADIPTASAALFAAGYKPPEGPQAGEGHRPQDDYHLGFARADGRAAVELHWAFTPGHFGWRCDLDRLWARAETVTLSGRPIRTPAPEDLLPLLCVHGAKRCWERLEWICGIAGLLRAAPDRDRQRVADEVRGDGGERVLILGLQLARDLLGAELPAAVHRSVAANPIRPAVIRQVCGWLFDGDGAISPRDRHAFFLASRERWGDRLRYLFFHLRNVNGRDRAELGFAARLLRPLRLVVLHGNPWQLLRRLTGR